MKLNYISIIICIIILVIYLEFNTKYTYNFIQNNNNYESFFNISNNNQIQNKLYIVTHDYEHKDIFIVLKELSKKKENFYILFADKIWNRAIELVRPNNIEFIYTKNSGNGTVSKLSNKLLLGYNIVIFLYKETNSSGLYWIIKETNCLVTLIKIKGIQNDKIIQGYNHFDNNPFEIFINNLFNNYLIEYSDFNYNNYLENKDFFMKNLINNLYS